MPPELAASTSKTIRSPVSEPIIAHTPPATAADDSLFEHVPWLYAFCREHLFRDDTARMIAALWPDGGARPGTRVIELGCGPGFYSARLARRFPTIFVTGVDRSENQLALARTRTAAQQLSNCSFARVNVLQLPFADDSFDILIASRLFTVLRDPDRVVAEMHRVLKPSGRCFIAEPRYAVWASIPLFLMWLLASVTHSSNGYREPRRARVFPAGSFEQIFAAHHWRAMKIWQDGRYQYALCEKD